MDVEPVIETVGFEDAASPELAWESTKPATAR
jgi:hypothetical protein